jgi:hypothetical protein
MPLIATVQPSVADDGWKAIGFWMAVEGARPVQPIRVFVTYAALAQIEPSQPRDRRAAMAIFEKNRTRIEAMAGAKFDTKGVDDGTHQGMPILMIRISDLS